MSAPEPSGHSTPLPFEATLRPKVKPKSSRKSVPNSAVGSSDEGTGSGPGGETMKGTLASSLSTETGSLPEAKSNTSGGFSPTTRVTSTSWYASEIQSMMHGFGDSPKPLLESAHLIEEIVQKQMMSLVLQASEVALLRGLRYVGLEDILFLMRKDKVKLVRLIRYLSFKDTKAAVLRQSGLEEEEALMEEVGSASEPSLQSSSESKPQQTKRVKHCYDFLSSIDQNGDLLHAFDDHFFDEIKHQRNLRIERMTRNMTETQYLKYCESRQTSFANRSRPNKFKEWLLRDNAVDLKPNAMALEVVQYLAYETVAELVDLSLLVKQDSRRELIDPLTGLLSTRMMNTDCPSASQTKVQNCSSSGQKKANASDEPSSSPSPVSASNNEMMQHKLVNVAIKGATGTGAGAATAAGSAAGAGIHLASPKSRKRKRADNKINLETSDAYSIQPADIREVVRRYFAPSGPFSLSQKSHSSLGHRLVCT